MDPEKCKSKGCSYLKSRQIPHDTAFICHAPRYTRTTRALPCNVILLFNCPEETKARHSCNQ